MPSASRKLPWSTKLMKTRILSPFKSLLLVVGGLLLFGCMDKGSKTSAEAASNAASAASSAPAAVDADKGEQPKADAAKSQAEPLKKISSPKRDLEPAVAEVVELVEAGV